MTIKKVTVPPLKNLIQPSSWKHTKLLADDHLDILKLCQYGCPYCSSNSGMHLKMREIEINQAVQAATGQAFDRKDVKNLFLDYPNVIGQLNEELGKKRRKTGMGKTIVFSELTDGFSPAMVKGGVAREALDLLLDKTDYRIRILTKNAIVGTQEWVEYFSQHRDRFVVGLSIGTLDEAFSRQMERFTSVPTKRVEAHRNLQDAGVPTYGMLCPVFPQVLENSDELERLVESIRPEMCEHVWAEPFNNRQNWEVIRKVYESNCSAYKWMTRVYVDGEVSLWSEYATDLYLRLRGPAESNGWIDKLRYMLYEQDITAEDAARYTDRKGLLLQCKTGADGKSKNAAFA